MRRGAGPPRGWTGEVGGMTSIGHLKKVKGRKIIIKMLSCGIELFIDVRFIFGLMSVGNLDLSCRVTDRMCCRYFLSQ